MKRVLSTISVAVFLSACTTVEDFSSHPSFRATMGNGKATKRVSYLYDMNADGVFEMRDSLHTYGQGLDDQGNLKIHTDQPMQTLPVGTQLKVDSVRRESGKGGTSIIARGMIHLEEGDVPFRYLVGIGNSYQDAPWISSAYQPRKFTQIESGPEE